MAPLFTSIDGRLTASQTEQERILSKWAEDETNRSLLYIHELAKEEPRLPYRPDAFQEGYWLQRKQWHQELQQPGEYERQEKNIRNQTPLLFQSLRSELTNLEAFCMRLRAMLKVLIAEPIMVETGQFTPRLAPPRLVADVKNEIANELARLPKFTARVKLSDGSGNAVEHTIQTYKLEKGLYGQALKERKERIRQRNIKDGYLIERTKVEAKITQRQRGCQDDLGGQTGSQPTPKTPPHPQRRVPLCSQCGAANQHGAKFCNQCGAKL